MIIHNPGDSSEECKVLLDFGAKYAKGKTFKDRGNRPVPRKCFNKQQENNAIDNNVVDQILLHKTQKVSAVREAPELLESYNDEKDVYEVERLSLEETNKTLNDLMRTENYICD